MSMIAEPTEASAWMLYGRWLRHRSDALRELAAGREENLEKDESRRNDRC